MCGSDGVFIGACLPGECHYADGNFSTMGKVALTQKVLANLGVNPDRLVMRMMSSAEGAKFVEHVTAFQDQIKKLGKLGSTEGLQPSELELKLKAAKVALKGKKLRWVVGKYMEFQQQGNLYGEKFTQHEFNRLFDEVAIDECAIQEILLRTKDQALSVKRLSEVMGLPSRQVLRNLVDMRKMGLVVLESDDKKTVTWRVAVSPAEAIESEKPISSVIENDLQMDLIKPLNFLTLKPIMVVANVGEDQLGETIDLGARGDIEVIQLCASLESELAQLDEADRAEFMADMGLTEPASKKFIQSCYSTLGLIGFLTVGKDEVRAWPIEKGTSALDAAGKIHSDIKRGFIRAETMAYADLKEFGDEKAVKAAGKTRLEGKTYTIEDGDIINFRFNV